MAGGAGYVIAVLIGALVGATEIIYRYRDDASWTLLQPGGLLYTAVNGGASAFALLVIRTFGWTFGASSGDSQDLLRVLVAGFGAVALFRTKLTSTITKDAQSLSWSPSGLLEQLLLISDNLAKRSQAKIRSRVVVDIMANVSFAKAYATLPMYALGLLTDVPEQEQVDLGDDIKKLAGIPDMADNVKAQQLGIALVRLTGASLLRQAVSAMGPSIAADESKPVGASLHRFARWQLRRG